MKLKTALLSVASLLALNPSANAADFTIANGQTETTSQPLSAGDTGIVETGGAINSASTAVTGSGADITFTNNGAVTAGTNAILGIGTNTNFTNNGTVDAADLGIVVVGDNSTAINSGTVTTANSGGFGISIARNNSRLINNGTVTTAGDGAYGLVLASGYNSTNTTVTNNGDVNTSGDTSDGIFLGPNSLTGNTITNSASGIITVTGNNSAGMSLHSDGNTAINRGAISASGGGNSYGLLSNYNDSTLINSGSISSRFFGIYSSGTNAVIENSGSVATTVTTGSAIWSTGTGSSVVNTGSITTQGNIARGIIIGADSSAVSSGSITTSGSNSHGIYAALDNSNVNNTGTITTTGNSSYGILVSGVNGVLVNNGTISVSGVSATGMQATDADNTLTNNGTITTNNTNGFGLYSTANNNTLVNNGVITNNGGNADGIYSGSGTIGNAVINNGVITVSGPGADGLNAETGNTITNNGRVTVLSGNGNAIRAYGNNITVRNNGFASSNSTYTVELTGNNNTLILGANSKIVGDVGFGGAGGAVQYDLSSSGRGGSVATITGAVSGSPTTTLINTSSLGKGSKVIQQGNTVAVVTADSFAGSNRAVTEVLSNTGDIIERKQQLSLLKQNSGTSSGDQVKGRTGWVEGFGSYQERPENDDADYSRARAGGVLAGIDLPQNSNGYTSGYYIGGFKGGLDIGSTKFRNIESDGFLVGGYVGRDLSNYRITTGLSAGYSNNDSDRKVGADIATADYDSYFVSPSVSIMRPYKAGSVTLVPSATLRYTYQYDTSYSEKGSLADQDVDSNGFHSLSGRAQLDAKLPQKTIGQGVLQPSLRAGVEGSTYIGDRSIDLKVLGTNTSFDPQGDDNYVDGIVGTNLNYSVTDSTELYVDAEASIGLNKGGASDNFGGTGRIGAKFKF